MELARDRHGNAIGTHPLKGKKEGVCNRQACQHGPVSWYNTQMDAYYCTSCAHAINDASLDYNGTHFCVRTDGKPHAVKLARLGQHERSDWHMSDGSIQSLTNREARATLIQ